jgi:hypothetical protein
LRDGFLMLGRGRGCEMLGLELDDTVILDTLQALEDLGFVAIGKTQYETGNGAALSGVRIAGRGLQVLGQWPSFEAVVDPQAIVETLRRLEIYAPEVAQRTSLQRAAHVAKGLGPRALREVIAGVTAGAVRGNLGLS